MLEVIAVDFLIKPGHVADFAAAVQRNAQASASTEAGCRQFDVCRDPSNERRFFLYELYDDEAAITGHRASAHYLRMQEEVREWVEHVQVRRLQRI